MKKFSCGIILCCVAAIALAGCPEYQYAPPPWYCESGGAEPDVPEGNCEWTGTRCEGCDVKLFVYGKYYPCRKGGENGAVVDKSNCSGENPLRCSIRSYISDVDCEHYSWSEAACEARNCKYKPGGTID